MKTFIVMLCLSLSAVASEIQPIRETGGILPLEPRYVCQDSQVADAGYKVEVSADQKTATLSEMTIMGSETLAELECVPVSDELDSATADGIKTILSCSEPELRDAGYAVQISQGGIAGLTEASIQSISIIGARPVGKVLCNN